jgi:hypothetical protein
MLITHDYPQHSGVSFHPRSLTHRVLVSLPVDNKFTLCVEMSFFYGQMTARSKRKIIIKG